MNILILGSGGREHAFALKLSESSKVKQLFVAPGNAGTNKIAKNINVDLSDFEAVKKIVLENNIKMVVVGPEVPLVEGVHDEYNLSANRSGQSLVWCSVLVGGGGSGCGCGCG